MKWILLQFVYLVYAEAVSKEEFTKVKYALAELEKKNEALLSEKTQLEEDAKQKAEALESADTARQEMEDKLSTLQADLDAVTKDSEILNKELLGEQYSIPFRYTAFPKACLVLTTSLSFPMQIHWVIPS